MFLALSLLLNFLPFPMTPSFFMRAHPDIMDHFFEFFIQNPPKDANDALRQNPQLIAEMLREGDFVILLVEECPRLH